ncbi:engBF, partial [gut metagenome]
NPYLKTADNIRKVYLATDGLPQAVVLKGYGNEGHDSANSEYADIAEREGGVEDFRKLIQIAHLYNTEVGVHINAQEAYPESKSFCDRMLGYPYKQISNGWGWLDQSHVIDKIWDLTSNCRWKRLVQFYDRINGTNFNTNQWPPLQRTPRAPWQI